jgi:NADH-quinone oxidoreductase subunit H
MIFLFFTYFLSSLLVILPLLLTVAYYTLLERKVMASLQRRYGPNRNGPWGLLQPILDGLKLLTSEIIVPTKANFWLFHFGPMLSMSISFTFWAIIPFSFGASILMSDYGLLTLFALSSMNVYSIVIAGWASNSKYALLGAIRAIAQMISYELILGVIVMIILLVTGSLNLCLIVYYQHLSTWLCFPLLPIVGITYVVLLAETNRIPFDLPEAEAELVAGYNVEYSSVTFALFFLGEYCSMIAMSGIMVILFFGGWLPLASFFIIFSSSFIFAYKIIIFCILFIVVRALLPRYRFDQLLHLGWHIFLPISFSFLIFLMGLLRGVNALIFDSCYNY